MLKILGGKVKGRALRTLPKDPGVRPILARIKKSLFDILRPRMAGCRFLDIYAGTGAVGLEALSQGAGSATFIEHDPKCVRIIHENIEIFGFDSNAQVFRMNATGDLSVVPKPYDIIFMGPPYKDAAKKPLALVTPTIENIARFNLLAPGGLVVAQHHKKEPVSAVDGWDMKRQIPYGDTIVSFFERAG